MSIPLQVSVIDAQTFQVAIPGDSVKYKTELLLAAQEVGQVTNPAELEAARAVVAEIKKAVNDVEKARVELTKPFLDTQRALKAKADEWRKELDAQISDVEYLISTYIRKEREKAAEIQRAAEAEERKRREEIARAARIELDRLTELKLQHEKFERLAQEMKTKVAREKAAAEALRLRKEQEALELERLEREPEPIGWRTLKNDLTTPLDTRGVSVRPTFEITITDIHALYAWNKNYVTLEPKLMLLKEMIAHCSELNQQAGVPDVIEIPGVQVKKVLKTSVRSAL